MWVVDVVDGKMEVVAVGVVVGGLLDGSFFFLLRTLVDAGILDCEFRLNLFAVFASGELVDTVKLLINRELYFLSFCVGFLRFRVEELLKFLVHIVGSWVFLVHKHGLGVFRLFLLRGVGDGILNKLPSFFQVDIG